MTIEAVQCIAESNPDLLYIQITAWATVGIMFATFGMIMWQINAAKSSNKIEISMRLIDQYDSLQMRKKRLALASILQNGDVPGSVLMETVVDHLDNIALLHRRKLLDEALIESIFSIPIRYWWCALEDDITKMRKEFNDNLIFEDFQMLASQYSARELAQHRDPVISQPALSNFLASEYQGEFKD